NPGGSPRGLQVVLVALQRGTAAGRPGVHVDRAAVGVPSGALRRAVSGVARERGLSVAAGVGDGRSRAALERESAERRTLASRSGAEAGAAAVRASVRAVE